MAKSPTAYLALQLPVPGSKEPFRVADVNEWFTILDAKAQTTDAAIADRTARIVTLEKYLRGTTAERDAVWGIPATPAARVALAAKGATWFNTDKGYEQQYFAQFDDAGVGTAPARLVHGWGPSRSGSEHLLDRFTLTNTAGTSAKQGATSQFTGVTHVMLDALLTDDFDNYRIELEVDSASVDASVYLRFRVGGATITTASYAFVYNEVTAGGANSPAAGAASATGIPVGRISATGGSSIDMVVSRPRSTTRRAAVKSASIDSTNYASTRFGTCSVLSAKEGIEINFGGAVTATGQLRVFGIAR